VLDWRLQTAATSISGQIFQKFGDLATYRSSWNTPFFRPSLHFPIAALSSSNT
jgi:hypothetical protein